MSESLRESVMNSRSGDRVPSGDGAEVDRGGAGELAPATGSARPLIGWLSLLLTVLCLVLALVTMRANGLLLLATIFAVVCAWAVGFFNRAFWR